MKYHVERQTSIKKDMATVKALIEDFSKWNLWSPWNIVEPDCKITVEGEAGKPGHKMAWDGEIIGKGTQELVSSEGGTLRYKLVFLTPWKSHSDAELRIEERGDETQVTWLLDSSMPFFMFFFVDMMKALIGMDFDRGLRMLKEIAEKGSVDAETTNKGVQPLEGFSYVGIKRRMTHAEMKKQMPKDFQKIIDDIVVKGGKSPKHWVSLYPKFHAKTNEMTCIAAVSDEGLEDLQLGEEYVHGKVESGKAYEIFHRGSFDFIGNAWSMGMMHVRGKKLKQRGAPFEYYHNSPLEVQPNELKTSVYFPLKG